MTSWYYSKVTSVRIAGPSRQGGKADIDQPLSDHGVPESDGKANENDRRDDTDIDTDIDPDIIYTDTDIDTDIDPDIYTDIDTDTDIDADIDIDTEAED